MYKKLRLFFAAVTVMSLIIGVTACSAKNTGTGNTESNGSSPGISSTESPSPATNSESVSQDDTSQSDTSQSDTDKPTDIAKITGLICYAGDAYDRIQAAGWFTDILKDKLGIELDFQDISGLDSQQILQTEMASGELPDIIGFYDASTANNAAAAGLLLNLDNYQDKLPSIYQNDFFKNAIAFFRDTHSGGKGYLTNLPTNVGTQDFINYDAQLRWDVYQQIGAPKISTLEDYLPVLKQMMDAYPTTSDGQNVYGLSIFSDWDNFTMGMCTYMSSFYGNSEYVNTLCETPADGSGDPRSILEDDSIYKRILKFFYTANQMGILDPDSATQTWGNVSDKYNQGRILFSPWTWAVAGYNVLDNTDVDNFTGYESVWADDFKDPIYADQTTGRGDWTLSVSANAANVDAVLKFINYLYSYEGVDMILNGPQGVLWDVGTDGLRYRTEQGWNIIQNDLDMPGGGKFGNALKIINSPTITPYTINPATNNQTLGSDYWESVIAYQPTRLVQDWRDKNGGFLNMLEKAKTTGQVIKASPAQNMMAAVPDDLQLEMTQIGDVVKTSSWKMVYAKDDTEFEALWTDLQTKAKGLGIDDIVSWSVQEWNNAKANADKYK